MWVESYFGTHFENGYFITDGVDPAAVFSIYMFNIRYPVSNPTVDRHRDIDGQATVLAAFVDGATLDNDVFSDYAAGAWNRNCWSSWWDLSGVGWSNDRTDNYGQTRRCALVGRDCAVGAYHHRYAVGDVVYFTDRLGKRYGYTVATVTQLGTIGDGVAYTFTEAVSGALTSYALATDVGAGDLLLCTRSRPVTAGTTSYRTMLEEVLSTNSVEVNFSADPTDAGALARYERGGTYDSSDLLFKPGSRRQPALVGGYASNVASSYYGGSAMLPLLDAELTTQGTARLAQSGVLSSPVVESTLTAGGLATSSPITA